MIRLLYLLSTCLLISGGVNAQNLVSAAAITPDVDYENVWLSKIADGEEATSYVIWIKEGVGAHYHAEHAEHIYIIGGSGTMRLGEESFEVKAGDFVRVPKGTIHAVTVTSESPLQVLSIQTPQFLGEDRHWVGQEN